MPGLFQTITSNIYLVNKCDKMLLGVLLRFLGMKEDAFIKDRLHEGVKASVYLSQPQIILYLDVITSQVLILICTLITMAEKWQEIMKMYAFENKRCNIKGIDYVVIKMRCQMCIHVGRHTF